MGRSPRIALISRTLVLSLLLGLFVAPAHAVVISFPDGTTNTTLPSFFGWDYVGEVQNASGTYIGDSWVITAAHVGPGDFTLDGVVYPWVQGSEQYFDNEGGPGSPDLVMFQVFPYPSLPTIPMASSPPELGEFSVMIGCGRDRGTTATYDPNGPTLPPEAISGWNWLGTRTKRWGTNEIEDFPVGLLLGTVALASTFDEEGHSFEAQGSDGDSGGGYFTVGVNNELVGIMYAVGPAGGQPTQSSMFTNQTYSARVDFYYDQIQDILALPEPSGALPAGVALVGLLARRRRS